MLSRVEQTRAPVSTCFTASGREEKEGKCTFHSETNPAWFASLLVTPLGHTEFMATPRRLRQSGDWGMLLLATGPVPSEDAGILLPKEKERLGRAK